VKPDHDTMMRLIRDHLSKDARKAVTHTVWKDGIDLDFPDHDIEAFYSAVRNEAIEECAKVMESPMFDDDVAADQIRALRTNHL